LAEKFPELTILSAAFNQIETFDDVQDFDNMKFLAEVNLEGNPLSNLYGFEDGILEMIPLIEVLNDVVLNEPGARFKLQKDRIKSTI